MAAPAVIVAAKTALSNPAVRKGVANAAKNTAATVAKNAAVDTITGTNSKPSVPTPRTSTGQLKAPSSPLRSSSKAESVIKHAQQVAGTPTKEKAAESATTSAQAAEAAASANAAAQAAAQANTAQAAQTAANMAALQSAQQAAAVQAISEKAKIAAPAPSKTVPSSDAKAASQKNATENASKSPLKKSNGNLKDSGKGLLKKKPGKKIPGSGMMKAMAFSVGIKIAFTVIMLIVIAGAISSCVGVVFGLVMGGSDSDEQVIEHKSMVMPVYKKPRQTCYVGEESEGSRSYNGLRGSTNEEKVWNFFYDHGYCDEAIAGIMGNCAGESGYDPKSEGTGGMGAFGFDYKAGTVDALKAYADENGGDMWDLETQCLFVESVMEQQFRDYTGHGTHSYDYIDDETGENTWCWWPDAMTVDDYKKVNDVDLACEIFMRVYEKPGIPHLQKNRIPAAREAYEKYKGKGASGSSSSSSSGSSSSGPSGNSGRLILIGDSRTVQMYNYQVGNNTDNITGTTDDGNVWRAKGSMGLAWMETDAVPYAEQQMQKGDNVVILFGVNDLGNRDQYTEYINGKAADWKSKGVNTYFVSVGPVHDDKTATYGGVKNSTIENFNAYQKSNLQGVGWIEIYDMMQKDGFDSDDMGVHYGANDYQKIYDTIKTTVANGPSNSGGRVLDEECQDEEKSESSGYTGGRQTYEQASAAQKKIVDITNDPPSDVNTEKDRCLGYVNDVFAYAGVCPRHHWPCATEAMWASEPLSEDFDNIPVGACIFTDRAWTGGPDPEVRCGSHSAGHIGIHIGGGIIRENVGGVRDRNIDDWVSDWRANGGRVAWGWLNGVDLSKS